MTIVKDLKGGIMFLVPFEPVKEIIKQASNI
jgi:hypothetical protein